MSGDVRDTFKLGVKQTPHTGNSMSGTATVKAVEWSPPQIVVRNNNNTKGGGGDGEETKTQYSDSLVAVAAFTGVICVWNAKQTFFSEGTGESSTLQNQQPEAILSQAHNRAVNSLAWHPKRPGIFLSASQVREIHGQQKTDESKVKWDSFVGWFHLFLLPFVFFSHIYSCVASLGWDCQIMGTERGHPPKGE